MKHLAPLTKRPPSAQSDVCTNLQSDYQALLCFVLEVLQVIFPSIIESKTPTQTT
jgi:hypothetical protein